MAKWKQPPIIKVYEALGTLADKRIEVNKNQAKVYSSSGNKYYEVEYDPHANSISSNDNGSYWVGYLGYPAIAFLMSKKIVRFDKQMATILKGFHWKDINSKYKNDFQKTQSYIDEQIVTNNKDINIENFHIEIENILDQVISLNINKPASSKKPPQGY